MTNKKRILSVLTALGLTAMVAAPLLAASCTKETRFDQVNDGKIKILSSWSETNKQGIALKAIVDEYNNSQKGVEGFMPVEIVTSAKGYNDNDWEAKLKAKDTQNFFNLIINYPTVASKIAQYNMNLSFDSIQTEINSMFSKDFLDVNSEIAGNAKNEIWTIPTTKSGEMTSINKAVLGKFISELEAYGAKIADDSKDWADEFKSQYNEKADEKTYIDNLWNDGKEQDQAKIKSLKETLSKYTISKNVLTNYADLLKFATLAKKLYPNNKNYIIGVDSFPNSAFLMAASLNNSTQGSLVVKDEKNQKDGGYDFTKLTQKDTPEYNRLHQIFDLIKEAIVAKALWIGGSGSHGSSLLVTHKMAMSIGSTAGYSYNFIKSGKIEFETNESLKLKNSINYLLLLQKPTKKNAVFTVIDNNNHKNALFARPLTNKDGKYDYGTKENDTKTVENLTKLAADNAKGTISSDKHLVEKEGKVYYDDILLEGASYVGEIGKGKSFYKYFFLPETIVKAVMLSQSQTLQENEATWFNAPSKFNSKQTTNYYTLQGPSIIGVHANEAENKATVQFVKWLLTEKIQKLTVGKNVYENKIPIEALADFASYLAPFKSTLNKDTTNGNAANKLLFNNLKNINDDSAHHKIVEDVPAPKSQTLRNALETATISAFNKAAISEVYKFEDFINAIKATILK